ncbi:DNA-binding response OmpR family regulator [Sphingomonas jejuensis]|uniref:DNA-binding response OmpR family regulator n=2 Tax=Sphingomonas jejuensis TaxID=904715 RepID=A0ABX0XJK1_9SPHN|nr:DNA-binding response OmpR family regulator [Sphingomonas jejuensis]
MREGGTALLRSRIGDLCVRYASAGASSALAEEIMAIVLEERGGRLVRGRLELDVVEREARLRGVRLQLAPREFALLHALACAGGAVSLATLRAVVLGRSFDTGTNAIAVHVSRLRAKLGRDAVLTTAEGGYRLNDGAISDARVD